MTTEEQIQEMLGESMPTLPPETYRAKEVPRILGVDPGVFYTMKKNGKIIPVSRGKYDKKQVDEMAKDMEERRKISGAKWVYPGNRY